MFIGQEEAAGAEGEGDKKSGRKRKGGGGGLQQDKEIGSQALFSKKSSIYLKKTLSQFSITLYKYPH